MDQIDHSLPVPNALLDALADRVAERLADRLGEPSLTSAAWMRTKDAADYLGLTRSALYSRIREMPHYRFERMLLFKRSDLDAWVESHRVEPSRQHDHAHAIQTPIRSRTTSARRPPVGDAIPRTSTEASMKRRLRERPLPPPLCGNEAQKRQWAKELEISREELDEMSPGEFKRAWDARNERLRVGGVFDHLDELWERLGQKRIESMTPSELIATVRELRKEEQQLPTPEAAETGPSVTDRPAP
jgi:excisionase family DNA binding protein